MMSSLYIGAVGMITLGDGMQVVANNLANVNTVAFKERMALYQDLYNSDVTAPSNNVTNLSQQGHGVKLSAISTRFYENGGFEAGADPMDMAISGKGFFKVTNGDKIAYTRAGNFRFTKEGALVQPDGYVLNSTSGPVQLTPAMLNMAAKASSTATLVSNLGMSEGMTSSATDPFFSMIGHWNGQNTPPIGEMSSGFRNEIQVYDPNGETHNLSVYYDKVSVGTDGRKIYQYVVGMSNPNEDARADFAGTKGAGILAAGTMTFTASGLLQDMTAYKPTSGAKMDDLSTWQGTSVGAGGIPLQLNFNSFDAKGVPVKTSQALNLNLGMNTAPPSGGGKGTAAAVGTDPANLPGYTAGAKLPVPTNTRFLTTAYEGSSSEIYRAQDGYLQGGLMRLSVTPDGVITGQYSNGKNQDLFQVPLYRFNGEQDLQAEGKNLFTPTNMSGAPQEGIPKTQNFGSIQGNSLELSNVDMARQFATMIITQRGFQYNSKVVTTADTMLQRAIELKR